MREKQRVEAYLKRRLEGGGKWRTASSVLLSYHLHVASNITSEDPGGRGIVIVEIKNNWRLALKIPAANKTSLVSNTKFHLAYFARRTHLLLMRHKQNLSCFPKFMRKLLANSLSLKKTLIL